MKKYIKLYTKFRRELDKMCIPLILEDLRVEPIYYNGKVAGMIVSNNRYIDCVYVKKHYRRRGLAKEAVEWLLKCRRSMNIHIINNNTIAYKFWSENFNLKEIVSNHVDTLYEVKAKEKREIKISLFYL